VGMVWLLVRKGTLGRCRVQKILEVEFTGNDQLFFSIPITLLSFEIVEAAYLVAHLVSSS
jgi:hypothetical protein